MPIKFPTLIRLDPESLPAQAVERIQAWGAEVSSIGDAVVSLIAKERAATDAALAATDAALAETRAYTPVAYGVFLTDGSGGFTARTSYGPLGKRTGADSGISISGTTAVVTFTTLGFALGDPAGACIVLSPYHNLGAARILNEISGSRNTTSMAIRCRDVSNTVVSFGSSAVGASFAVYRTT